MLPSGETGINASRLHTTYPSAQQQGVELYITVIQNITSHFRFSL